MTKQILDTLALARAALKPSPIPMRTLRPEAKGGLSAAVLREVDQTVLARLLTFVSPAGKRIVVLASDRRVHSLRSSDGGQVEDQVDAILNALATFSAGQESASVATAPPPNAVRPKGDGHRAKTLLEMLIRPDAEEEAEAEDFADALRGQMSDVFTATAMRTARGRVVVPMEESSQRLGEVVRTVATDLADRHNFLDEAVPGPKLILHGGAQPSAPAIAYTSTAEQTLLASCDTSNLAAVMSAWQRLSGIRP